MKTSFNRDWYRYAKQFDIPRATLSLQMDPNICAHSWVRFFSARNFGLWIEQAPNRYSKALIHSAPSPVAGTPHDSKPRRYDTDRIAHAAILSFLNLLIPMASQLRNQKDAFGLIDMPYVRNLVGALLTDFSPYLPFPIEQKVAHIRTLTALPSKKIEWMPYRELWSYRAPVDDPLRPSSMSTHFLTHAKWNRRLGRQSPQQSAEQSLVDYWFEAARTCFTHTPKAQQQTFVFDLFQTALKNHSPLVALRVLQEPSFFEVNLNEKYSEYVSKIATYPALWVKSRYLLEERESIDMKAFFEELHQIKTIWNQLLEEVFKRQNPTSTPQAPSTLDVLPLLHGWAHALGWIIPADWTPDTKRSFSIKAQTLLDTLLPKDLPHEVAITLSEESIKPSKAFQYLGSAHTERLAKILANCSYATWSKQRALLITEQALLLHSVHMSAPEDAKSKTLRV